ncbi:11305_t:CDS:1, partial [Ambispora gerdemannii]
LCDRPSEKEQQLPTTPSLYNILKLLLPYFSPKNKNLLEGKVRVLMCQNSLEEKSSNILEELC